MISDIRFSKHATWGSYGRFPESIKSAVGMAAYTLGFATKVAEQRANSGALTEDEVSVLTDISDSTKKAGELVNDLLSTQKIAADASDANLDQALFVLTKNASLRMDKVAADPADALQNPAGAAQDIQAKFQAMLQRMFGGGGGGGGAAAAAAPDPSMVDQALQQAGGVGNAAQSGLAAGGAAAGGARALPAAADPAAAPAAAAPGGEGTMPDAGGGDAGDAGGIDVQKLLEMLQGGLGDIGAYGQKGLEMLQGGLGDIGQGNLDFTDPVQLAIGGAGALGAGGLGLLGKKLLGGKGKKQAAIIDLEEAETGVFRRVMDYLAVPAESATRIMNGKTAGFNIGVLSLLAA